MTRAYPTVLELVGSTPLVRLQQIVPEEAATIVAKLEYLNPGGSVKDRIGIRMIEAAEREGKLKPGGTIVEPTSGNTGTGLAIAAALKGYRCIFVMPDKMSQEKISMLRAYGAEVVICPTAVEPDSPESYYSVSDRLAAHQKVGEAIDMMQRYSISQLPVVRDGELGSLADVIGSLQDRDLLDRVFKNPDALHEDVASAMQPPLAAVEADQTLDEVFATLTGRTNAVVVARDGKPVGVLTRSDLLEYLAHQRGASTSG